MVPRRVRARSAWPAHRRWATLKNIYRDIVEVGIALIGATLGLSAAAWLIDVGYPVLAFFALFSVTLAAAFRLAQLEGESKEEACP